LVDYDNNPLSFKDPTGLEPESEKGGEDRMLTNAVQDLLEESFAAENATQAMFDDMRALMSWNIFCGEYGIDVYTGQRWSNLYYAGGGGGANNNGNRNKDGSIRLSYDGAPEEEVYAMAMALGAVTGAEIIVDKNGIITEVRKTSEDAKYQKSRDWLIELMSKVKENDITLILGFFDPEMLGETGNGFFQNGTLCGESIPTVGIQNDMFFYSTSNESFYIYKSGEENVLFGLWTRNKYDLYPYTIERVIGHEFFGHAYDYVIYGNISRTEEFAMSRGNSIGLIFNQPKRYSYHYKRGFELIPFGIIAP